LPFLSAVPAHRLTVPGLIPASREALWSEILFSLRITEITPATFSRRSLKRPDFAPRSVAVGETTCLDIRFLLDPLPAEFRGFLAFAVFFLGCLLMAEES
jgi:hypothetical protein